MAEYEYDGQRRVSFMARGGEGRREGEGDGEHSSPLINTDLRYARDCRGVKVGKARTVTEEFSHWRFVALGGSEISAD